jgi:hypothetical protein
MTKQASAEQLQNLERELDALTGALSTLRADVVALTALLKQPSTDSIAKRKRVRASVNVAGLLLFIVSVYVFGFYSEHPRADSRYAYLCCALYMLWTIGVPAWFATDYEWFYDKRESLEEFKYKQDLAKSGWISVAVVLAAIFAVRTHLDLPEHLRGTEEAKVETAVTATDSPNKVSPPKGNEKQPSAQKQ